MSRLRFYLKLALSDMRVNRQRTLFALLCIAAGVAAIVSLQTLGVMIQARLTGNLQEMNRGDMRILPATAGDKLDRAVAAGVVNRGILGISDTFTAAGLEQIQAWFAAHFAGNVTIVGQQIRVVPVSIPAKNAVNPMTFEYMADVAQYPLYGAVADESGTPLSELLTSPHDIVINRSMADGLGAQVGDVLHVAGSAQDFILRGVLPDNAEAGNIYNAIVGYYLVDDAAMSAFGQETLAVNTLYVRLSDTAQIETLRQAFLADFPYLDVSTPETLAQQNAQTSQSLHQLVNVMGLLALLMGGIGIVNTMQVIVSRRMLEIATLKTLGLEAGQITRLFLTEAFLMGIVGSMAGVLLGWSMVFVVKSAAESFIMQSLTVILTPAPALSGLVVGVLMTTIFGFLPTLPAGRIRPALVLHPAESIMPRAGCLPSLAVYIVMTLALIAVATALTGSVAVVVIPAAFILTGILYVVLRGIIRIVGRFFPAFGVMSLKLALRAIHQNRQRGASTLLALVTGVFTLSLVTLLAAGVQQQFEQAMINQTGGNVSVFAPAGADTLDKVQSVLANFAGVQSYAAVAGYAGKLVAAYDASAGETLTPDDLEARLLAKDATLDANTIVQGLAEMDAREVSANLPELKFWVGRQLTAEDANQPVMVIGGDPNVKLLGLEPGDTLTFEFRSGGFMGIGAKTQTLTLTIVGITDLPMGRATPVGSMNYAPRAVFAGITPNTVQAVLQMDETRLPELRNALADIPGVFVVATRTFSSYISSIIRQFSTFPVLVAIQTLLVGGIVIANSVALVMMERRRDIATMKAIGVQRERILGMLLLENGILGVIGGGLGVGLGLLMLWLIAGILQQDTANLPYGMAFALMGLCLVISLAAALLSAWVASGEKPLNVLRYE